VARDPHSHNRATPASRVFRPSAQIMAVEIWNPRRLASALPGCAELPDSFAVSVKIEVAMPGIILGYDREMRNLYNLGRRAFPTEVKCHPQNGKLTLAGSLRRYSFRKMVLDSGRA
jgi:hypothetical protein